MRSAKALAANSMAIARADFEDEMARSKRELARALVSLQREHVSSGKEGALPFAHDVMDAVAEPFSQEVAEAVACVEELVEDARRLDDARSDLHARVVSHAQSELRAHVIDFAAKRSGETAAFDSTGLVGEKESARVVQPRRPGRTPISTYRGQRLTFVPSR